MIFIIQNRMVRIYYENKALTKDFTEDLNKRLKKLFLPSARKEHHCPITLIRL